MSQSNSLVLMSYQNSMQSSEIFLRFMMEKVVERVYQKSMNLQIAAKWLFSDHYIFDKRGRETVFDRKVVKIDKILPVPNISPLCDAISDLKKGFVATRNGFLYFEEEGEKMPLVLINPGPGGTHHYFHPFFSQIKDVAKIIYYDPRGVGQSSIDPTGEHYTIEEAIKDLDNLRKALKIHRWVVLGWSFGGFIAKCYALVHPNHVLGLVLVASSIDGLKKIPEIANRGKMFISLKEEEQIAKIQKMKTEKMITEREMLFNTSLAGDWKYQHFYKPSFDEMAQEALYGWKPTFQYRKWIFYHANQIALDGQFVHFALPTLIMEAKWDLSYDFGQKCKVIQKEHPHSEIKIFRKSGHEIFGDEPYQFFKTLRKFFKEKINCSLEANQQSFLVLANLDSKKPKKH